MGMKTPSCIWIELRTDLERFPIRLTRKLQGSWPEKRSRFDVCRISYRKTGIHFSGKCSKGRDGSARRGSGTMSGRDELVPLARQVAILIHYRVPHGDIAQPL